MSEFFFSHWVTIIVVLVYSVSIISICNIIVLENRNPVRSLAWITVLLFLPVIGLVFYLFFGRNIKNKALISKRLKKRSYLNRYVKQVDIAALPLTEESRGQIMLGHQLAGATYFPNNDIQIFTNGREMFDAYKKDLLQAQQFINIQFYIFKDDKIGNEIAEILMEKARAGVIVRVIYDHVGSLRVSKAFFRRLKEAGVEVCPFFKVTFPEFATRVNWRNHRKITTIDGVIGYIGGMNLADRYVEGLPDGRVWRDTHIRIYGPSCLGLVHSFHLDWRFMEQPLFSDIAKPLPRFDRPAGEAGVQILSSGPIGQWHNISMMFDKAISSAKKCVYIETPYFLPTESLLRSLQTAALSKVDVRIIVPRTPDSRMLKLATASYIGECLRAGIKFYYYEPGMLHSKNIIIDEEFTTTGSTNFDFRSMEYNFECNAFIYSREINAKMKEIFMTDLGESTRILSSTWKHRPFLQKLKESLVRLMSPVL